MNDVVKQSENNGSGFDKNPQNINKNGRPKKGQAITEILKDLLEQETDGITRKQRFAEKVLELALRGNESMIKLVWAYVDGSPALKYEDKKGQKTYLPLLVEFIGEDRQPDRIATGVFESDEFIPLLGGASTRTSEEKE
jgi:flagellar hook-basal body complex protein FliE